MLNQGKVILRLKKPEDASNDYKWLKDPELARLDAIKPLTISFREYLTAYASVLSHTSLKKRQFAIETRGGEHIGNCACYNINKIKGEAEVGIMIGNRRFWGQGYGSDAITALVDYIFRETDLNRLRLKTLDYNFRAQRCFDKCGFVTCGRVESDSHSFILLSLDRRRWLEQRQNSKRPV